MKITKITPYLISAPSPFLPTANDSGGAVRNREYLFVSVDTDAGVTGWGEVTCTRGSGEPGCGLADFAGVGAAGGR